MVTCTHNTGLLFTSPSGSTEKTLDRAGIFLDVFLGDGAVGKVWGGWMIVEGVSFPSPPRRIAMKISTDTEGRDSLEREGMIYEYLGSAGPQCYGVFEDGKGTTALLLDFLGTRVTGFDEGSCPRYPFLWRMRLLTNYITIQQSFREKVYAAACTLHQAHVIHNDIEPRNVLIDREGGIHIIDFHVSQIDHECEGPGKCDELDGLADRLGIQQGTRC
jgi:hypothetical protein